MVLSDETFAAGRAVPRAVIVPVSVTTEPADLRVALCLALAFLIKS